MSIMEGLADELAQEALAKADAAGDEDIVKRVAETIGASSTTMEEAFLTAVRIRKAEARARTYLKGL